MTGVSAPSIVEFAQAIHENVGRVIVGKDEVVDLLLVALLAGGRLSTRCGGAENDCRRNGQQP